MFHVNYCTLLYKPSVYLSVICCWKFITLLFQWFLWPLWCYEHSTWSEWHGYFCCLSLTAHVKQIQQYRLPFFSHKPYADLSVIAFRDAIFVVFKDRSSLRRYRRYPQRENMVETKSANRITYYQQKTNPEGSKNRRIGKSLLFGFTPDVEVCPFACMLERAR